MSGRRSPRDADAQAMRRAALSVTRWVSIASCALVVAIVAVAIAFVIVQSKPRELLEPARPGQHKIYVDIGSVLVALGVLGAMAIVFAAVASWLIARRAVRPLGRALQLQRTFIADASHELRTPLAVLDARLQLLQRRLPADDPTAPTVAELRRDTHMLIDTVSELLIAAGGDETTPTGEPTDACAVAAAAIADLQLLADERGIDIVFTGTPGPPVAMPAAAFRRCVIALVDNALAHTPDNGVVDVAVGAAGRGGQAARGGIALRVRDHGPGIRGIEAERVFERFAHADASSTGIPRRRGFGIGLALVRDVAARSGGTVHVAETSPAGTTIVLELPRG